MRVLITLVHTLVKIILTTNILLRTSNFVYASESPKMNIGA